MLTPFYLLDAPERVVGLFSELEEFIIHDIARRVAKTGTLTDTAEYQAQIAKELGTAKSAIAKEVAYTLEASEENISRLLYDSTMESLEADDEVYRKAGLNPAPPKQSEYIQNYIKAMAAQTQEEMKNFTRSMGFKTQTGFMPVAQYYQHALDFAHLKVTTGAVDYQTAIRQAVKEIADSGIQFVDYESGWVNRADVAVRRAVLTGVSKTAGELAIMRADEFGITTMEITAHAGARPGHALWQGQIVDRSGQDDRYLTLSDIGYGEVTGFKGANCRHDWAPFVPGVSERVYTEKDLREIDPPPFEYNGKTYTYYEATQRQRQIETAMRKTKREIIAYDGAGDKDMFTAKSILLRRQREEYAAFSKAAGIRSKTDSIGVLGYGHSISQKAVQAGNRVFTTPTTNGIIKKDLGSCKNWSDFRVFFKQTYSCSISNDLEQLDFKAVLESAKGIDRVLTEFPAARQVFSGISTDVTGLMCTTFSGEIRYNPKYYSSFDNVGRAVAKAAEIGLYHKNSSVVSNGAHEAGHILERALIERNTRITDKALAWRKGTCANSVMTEAYKALKNTPYGKNRKYKDLISEVSRYAMQDKAEALAECVSDFVTNGMDASPLSIKVWEILKRRLG